MHRAIEMKRSMRIGAAAALACLALSASFTPAAAQPSIDWEPMLFRQVSYTRPFVHVVMNGKPFLLMVHSQAGFYAQTTHANAIAMGLTLPPPQAHFGITEAGNVSDLGATGVRLPTLQVAGDVVKNIPLTVFEIPQASGDGKSVDGMIGIAWLRSRGVIVDYDASRLGIPASPAAALEEGRRLRAAGYVAHKMIWDEQDEEYYVSAAVNGVPARLAVSTVGVDTLNDWFVKRAKIALGPAVGVEGGPGGAVVNAYLVKKQVLITLDGQVAAPSQPQSLDRNAYLAGESDQTVPDDGQIAADFMLANQAVIDFGNGTLFLRRDANPLKGAAR